VDEGLHQKKKQLSLVVLAVEQSLSGVVRSVGYSDESIVVQLVDLVDLDEFMCDLRKKLLLVYANSVAICEKITLMNILSLIF
jgi:hypothetical protein